MTAIIYEFKCADCGSTFRAPEVPENSYGLFVMRTANRDTAAFLEALSDGAFLESYALLKTHKLASELSDHRRGKLQQAVFAFVCDPSPDGERFNIGLLPKCASCGSRNMRSWQPVVPGEPWILENVKHEIWDSKTSEEKIAMIDRAIQEMYEQMKD